MAARKKGHAVYGEWRDGLYIERDRPHPPRNITTRTVEFRNGRRIERDWRGGVIRDEPLDTGISAAAEVRALVRQALGARGLRPKAFLRALLAHYQGHPWRPRPCHLSRHSIPTAW